MSDERPAGIRLIDIARLWSQETDRDEIVIAGELGRLLEKTGTLQDGAAWVVRPLGDKRNDIAVRLTDLTRYFGHGDTLLGTWPSGYPADRVYLSRDWLTNMLTQAGIEPPEFLRKPVSREDAALGAQVREQRSKFGRLSAEERRGQREAEHELWRTEAGKIREQHPRLARNKSAIAARVKANLKLSEGIDTIRKRI